MIHYTMTEAKAKFAEVVAKAAAGEDIMVTKMGKPMAKIIAPDVKGAKGKSRLGFLKTPCRMADDFDEWPEDVARALGMID